MNSFEEQGPLPCRVYPYDDPLCGQILEQHPCRVILARGGSGAPEAPNQSRCDRPTRIPTNQNNPHKSSSSCSHHKGKVGCEMSPAGPGLVIRALLTQRQVILTRQKWKVDRNLESSVVGNAAWARTHFSLRGPPVQLILFETQLFTLMWCGYAKCGEAVRCLDSAFSVRTASHFPSLGAFRRFPWQPEPTNTEGGVVNITTAAVALREIDTRHRSTGASPTASPERSSFGGHQGLGSPEQALAETLGRPLTPILSPSG